MSGYDAEAPGFYWLAGQGGYGFQTTSAKAELAAAQLLAGLGGAGLGAAAGTAGPDSRTAQALAATRWSVRR